MDKPSETSSQIEEVAYAPMGRSMPARAPDDRKIISGFKITLAAIVAVPLTAGFLIILFLLLGGKTGFFAKWVNRLL